ncbi:hypothetical protein ACFWBC_13270 [Streptomyces sp. NPDC059985]|uniref:hypothetical protein n=1 Tax=Streptomyces sp. NPDC059985 TaxID=3347025 RepID=UPI0036927E9F
MSPPLDIEVPDSLVASYAGNGGEAERAWTGGLPTLAAELLGRWELEPDGDVGSGEAPTPPFHP